MVARFLKKKKKQLPCKKGAEFRSNDLIPILLKRPVPLKIIDKYIVCISDGKHDGEKHRAKKHGQINNIDRSGTMKYVN